MNVVVGIGGASSAAMLLVALFKLGIPAAPSWAIAIVAFVAGQLTSLLVTMVDTGVDLHSQKVIGTMILVGITASAAAAGISKTDQKAEDKRDAAAAPNEAKALQVAKSQA